MIHESSNPLRFAKPEFQSGLRRSLVVREEIRREHQRSCRLAFGSDIHLWRGRSRLRSDQVVDGLQRARPDGILLGGDLVDQASVLQHGIQRLTPRTVKCIRWSKNHLDSTLLWAHSLAPLAKLYAPRMSPMFDNGGCGRAIANISRNWDWGW